MNETSSLLDPELALKLISILSWVLIILGLGKMAIYALGEWAPSVYERIKSEGVKTFLTGKGNRWLFGFGGFITALIGVFGLALGHFFAFLLRSVG